MYLFSKPEGLTSRTASTLVARAWGYSKRGHCGTLDPAARGVLPVLLGSATRLSPFLTGGSKIYSFTLVLGVTTDTDDMEGKVISRTDASAVTPLMLSEALSTLTGSFRQKAPLFSAVRVEGVRAYRSARTGGRPDMPSRTVYVCDWETGELKDCAARLRVTVSPGTYIRALARDAGGSLGVGGVATEIVREFSGGFGIDECSGEYDDTAAMLTMAEAMRGYPVRRLTQPEADAVLHGISVQGSFHGTVAMVSEDGRLMAVGAGNGETIHPACVLEKPC
ncbi:MAG: tRNA pseudouridine(55) synthase TruB [Candidatus Fermentibacteraceae bacterium]